MTNAWPALAYWMRTRLTLRLLTTDRAIVTEIAFQDADIRRIVGAVNYWLRTEVTPYWDMRLLRLEIAATDAPRSDIADALRAALFGLAVAWGMCPEFDPEEGAEYGTQRGPVVPASRRSVGAGDLH